MKYKNIFFDLDDTLWAFSENSRDTFEEMYNKYNLDTYFDSFEHYYGLYEKRNVELWELYGRNEITKEELNHQRFSYPLIQLGVDNPSLVKSFMKDFFAVIPTKEKLIPYAKEVLEYLYPNYNLFILSNGFRELQALKMQASGIDKYFQKVILSEDIGIMKPYPQIFHFALSSTQSEIGNSIMIGDSFVNDIQGAKGVDMDQIYFEPDTIPSFNYDEKPTYLVRDLKEIMEIL